jgi:hypothetical protein
MSAPYTEQFPYLFNLVGGWFHQDYDIEGNSLEEIVSSFKKGAPAEDVVGTRSDIRRFLRLYDGPDLQQAFVRLFEPGVLPAAWNMDLKQWLLKIDELL